MLGPDVVVARSEDHCGEHMHIVRRQRTSAGQTDFDGTAGWLVDALQAGRQRRGVVGDHEIAGAEVVDEMGARLVRDATRLVDDEKFRGGRTLDGSIGGHHRATSIAWSVRAIASISSAAATSGLLSDAGSASGTAIA